jgi:uncharacterized protein YqjF (DUF2071 family)
MVVWFEIMTSSKLKKILEQTEHHPYPLPKRPRVLRVRRHELLFMHWPVPKYRLRPLVPPVLELDTFYGSAWLGVMPFRMKRTRPRFLPALPRLSGFPELKFCSYVTAEGKPGIWFFSLEASTPIAARPARATHALAYFDAKMSCRPFGDKVQYKRARTHKGASSARLAASYRPLSEPFESRPGMLENVLSKRCCLYSADKKERIRRGDIHHRICDPCRKQRYRWKS